jgi:hypothetical protein
MSELLEKVYLKNTRMSPGDWPGATCDLANEDGCRELAAHLYYIHNVLRASAQQIVINQGSRPIADNVTSMEEEIEAKCKERDTKVKDFDSYRRRLKDLNAKKVIHIYLFTYLCGIFIYMDNYIDNQIII